MAQIDTQAPTVISFDLDDTLWDIWPIIDRAEDVLHAWLEARYPRLTQRYTAGELRALGAVVAGEAPDMAHDRTWIRKRALARAAQSVDYADFDIEAAFEVFYVERNRVDCFADAIPALEHLATRYRLVALTNGNADLHRIGLGHLFEFMLCACDTGVAKPDAAMFHMALARLGVPARQMIHVGDHPEHDVAAAAQVGCRTVWVNRGGQPWPEHLPAPDLEVRTLEGLHGLIATLA